MTVLLRLIKKWGYEDCPARLIGYENDNEERNEVAMKVVIKTAMKAVMKI